MLSSKNPLTLGPYLYITLRQSFSQLSPTPSPAPFPPKSTITKTHIKKKSCIWLLFGPFVLTSDLPFVCHNLWSAHNSGKVHAGVRNFIYELTLRKDSCKGTDSFSQDSHRYGFQPHFGSHEKQKFLLVAGQMVYPHTLFAHLHSCLSSKCVKKS